MSARRAQELARQQMEFVAAVSHELRTPVSVIGAAAGNLADGVVGDPQRVRKYGETIQGEARRLGETVERVLQLAGIAAGRAAAAQTPISPPISCTNRSTPAGVEIDAAGFNVEVAIAEDLPNVVGDVTALKSALQNLISNAVKYGGDARWLRVSASRPPRSAGHTVDSRGIAGPTVLFTVEDRGIGIDADDRKHIFEPFYRGRDAVVAADSGQRPRPESRDAHRRSAWRHGQRDQRARQGQHVHAGACRPSRSAAHKPNRVSLVREATSPR